MKLLVKKLDSKKIQEHEVATFFEYELPFEKFSVGVSVVNGRYPNQGFDVDEQIDQVWYVESGRGKVWIAGRELQVSNGDMVLIPKGEKYWIEGEALRLVVSSSPPWFAKQHKHIKK